MTERNDENKIAHLIGVGLDNKDGGKRITRAEKFSVVGGSEETHDRITETLVKTMEDIKRKGRTLEETGAPELAELLQKNRPN